MTEELILVDERNRAIGHAEKWAVHQQGLLHRAFSIFLVDSSGRLLLQQRSRAKYHSGGLWANSCCGHPRPGERTASAAKRRLVEELGAGSVLHYGFRARYLTALPSGLTENEIVYIYFGAAPLVLLPNPDEVASTAWMLPRDLRRDLRRRPGRYAYWLKHYLAGHFRQIEAGVTDVLRRAPQPGPGAPGPAPAVKR
jgi:isopentenyl-diphosphate delta-isomerase